MEFVQFIVNLYTCNMYYSILSSELLSNGYFLFFTNAFIGEDVMIYKHLLFSIFYFKKNPTYQ